MTTSACPSTASAHHGIRVPPTQLLLRGVCLRSPQCLDGAALTPSASTHREKHHRCPGGSIRHAVWLSVRCPLRRRDVEAWLGVRGVLVSYEAMRKRCRTWGQPSAHRGCFTCVGPSQMARPNSYRLMNRPSTRSCICSVLEKQMVRRTSRFIRVRRLMGSVP